MTSRPDLWDVRDLDGGLTLELLAGDAPALVLAQVENRVWVALHDVKALIGALTDAAAELVTAPVVSGTGDGRTSAH
jgi:hypothetical protein